MKFEDYKKDMLARNPKLRKLYAKPDLKWDIKRLVMFARVEKGWSQEKLAKKVSTAQESISRLEGARMLPSLTFLERVAKALGKRVKVTFEDYPKEV